MKNCLLKNQPVRKRAHEKGVRLWELADALGVSQATMTRKLSRELPSTESKKYCALIDQIAADRAGAC